MRMLVTAAPGMLESRVRRRLLPRVYPKPGSSGSMTNRLRYSLTLSSESTGRCAISTFFFLPAIDRYMTIAHAGGEPGRTAYLCP
jgi:hypothetical protein